MMLVDLKYCLTQGAFWLPVVLSILVVIGCERRQGALTDSGVPTSGPETRLAVTNKADLERILVPGLATNAIVASLGPPALVETFSEANQVWHLRLPPFEDKARRGAYAYYIAGVSLAITNGRLAYWACEYMDVSTDRVVQNESMSPTQDGATNSTMLQFFLVHSSPIADGQFIDTQRFPNLGFISRTPLLAIRKLKDVRFMERVPEKGQGVTNWSFGIFLNHEDTAKLEAITKTNVSRKLFVTVGDEPVVAATIIMPIETGSFEIECQDRSVMESVKDKFAALQRESE